MLKQVSGFKKGIGQTKIKVLVDTYEETKLSKITCCCKKLVFSIGVNFPATSSSLVTK